MLSATILLSALKVFFFYFTVVVMFTMDQNTRQWREVRNKMDCLPFVVLTNFGESIKI